MNESLPQSVETARERAVQLLSHHYAYDRLSLEQVEQRLEMAYRATSVADLNALLVDLPASPIETATTGERQFYQLATPGEREQPRRLLSFFSEVKRRGSWSPPRKMETSIIFGSMLLDFREAHLQAGVTEIDTNVIFGSLKVIAPPGVRVVSEGSAIFGSFHDASPGWDDLPADAPTIRIMGSAFFGSTEVQIRLPGESGLAALRRKWGV